jgi:hypothetical protein
VSSLKERTESLWALVGRVVEGRKGTAAEKEIYARADDYIAESLKVLGGLTFEQVAAKMDTLDRLHALASTGKEPTDPPALETWGATNSKRAMFLCQVWHRLEKNYEANQAGQYGFTPEEWAKLDLTEQSRAFARAKKAGRVS